MTDFRWQPFDLAQDKPAAGSKKSEIRGQRAEIEDSRQITEDRILDCGFGISKGMEYGA
jgi:hypothetical protein